MWFVPNEKISLGTSYKRWKYYLSPAPQAEGVSAGLSPAPQAEPQAAGVSAGLSPAPQAEPQAAGVSVGLSPAPQAEAVFLLFHPDKLESAIVMTSCVKYSASFAPCSYHCTYFPCSHKYALFYWDTHFFVTFVNLQGIPQISGNKFFSFIRFY